MPPSWKSHILRRSLAGENGDERETIATQGRVAYRELVCLSVNHSSSCCYSLLRCPTSRGRSSFAFRPSGRTQISFRFSYLCSLSFRVQSKLATWRVWEIRFLRIGRHRRFIHAYPREGSN